MKEMGHRACKADPDLWLKEQTNKQGDRYYAYIFPPQSEEGAGPDQRIYLGPPEFYLGARLRRQSCRQDHCLGPISPSKYVQAAIKNCEAYLKDKLNGNYSLPKKAENPFPHDYSPDEDVSPLLGVPTATYYMQLIGILRWIWADWISVGKHPCFHLTLQCQMPREDHFKAVLHVMGYLKAHSNSHLIFDPEKPNVSNCGFKEYSSSDWGAEYDGAEELIPVDAPKALGKSVLLRMFVDSDHAGDKKSRCSRTGFVILVNGGIIDWLSEKQSTIETLVFGAKFCALKHSIENLRSIRYKLRMMGVPIDGATRIFGDNMSVVTNRASRSLILFATMQYAVVMGKALVAHIGAAYNLADLFTKALYGQTCHFLVGRLMYDLFPYMAKAPTNKT
ncbi:LOW QUALITY PROTEIN: hypothetical protein ACHAXN_007340 [Cyclotella atomus]